MIIFHILGLIAGFLLLIGGGQYFIDSIVHVAKKLGISELVIGLTLVAGGTSLPELASSVAALLNGHSEVLLGNIMGSNIANIALIMAIVAIVSEVKVAKVVLKRDGYIMVAVSIILLVFSANGMIGALEGVVFILIYIAYVLFLVESRKYFNQNHFEGFVNYLMNFKYLHLLKAQLPEVFPMQNKGKDNLKKPSRKLALDKVFFSNLVVSIVSLTAIVFGAKFLMSEVIYLVTQFNFSGTFIGATLLAVGTSLPELSVSLIAIKKHYSDISIGNIMGSNITNVLLVVGICAIIRPVKVGAAALLVTIPYMILVSVLLVTFMRNNNQKISKGNGILLLFMYACFLLITYFI